jgi:hypothetical protein
MMTCSYCRTIIEELHKDHSIKSLTEVYKFIEQSKNKYPHRKCFYNLYITWQASIYYRKYNKQDRQGKVAFKERNPHTTQQQEPVANFKNMKLLKTDTDMLENKCKMSLNQVYHGLISFLKNLCCNNHKMFSLPVTFQRESNKKLL